MSGNHITTGPDATLGRIMRATNDHDLDALTACFEPDYESVWPVHPARTFAGTEQVRNNWQQIFTAVPDIRVAIVDSVVSDDEVWSEWEFAGNRVDGGPFLMRGVIIVRARDGRASQGRFYLEPVEVSAEDATAAVRRLLGLAVGGSEAQS